MNGRAGMGVRGKGRRLNPLPCSLNVEEQASALAGVEGANTPTHTQGRAMETSPAKANLGPKAGGLLIRRSFHGVSKHHGVNSLRKEKIAVPRLCPNRRG